MCCLPSAPPPIAHAAACGSRWGTRILWSKGMRWPLHWCLRWRTFVESRSMPDVDGPVAVAMSGGVDSSTVAALLVREGRSVVGLTMQLWNQRRLPELAAEGATGRCCSLDDVYDARRVAEQIGIPYYVVNFEKQFEEQVVRPFVDEYLAG